MKEAKGQRSPGCDKPESQPLTIACETRSASVSGFGDRCRLGALDLGQDSIERPAPRHADAEQPDPH